MVTDQGYSQTEADRHLDVNANMIGRWIKELSDSDGQAFRGNGKLTPDQEEIKKLRVEVKRLEMERQSLKGYGNRQQVFERSGSNGGVPGLDF